MAARGSKHALIVGGTGMLRDASLYLARHSLAVTSIARTAASLNALDAPMKATGTRHRAVPADYSDSKAFGAALATAINVPDPPDLVLAWIHDLEPAFALAERIGRESLPFDFYHVLGSAMSDPAKSRDGVWRRFENVPGITYRRIMLGFVIEKAGSRWLTNEEISAGTIRAIESRAAVSAIGVVRPWSVRPPRL